MTLVAQIRRTARAASRFRPTDARSTSPMRTIITSAPGIWTVTATPPTSASSSPRSKAPPPASPWMKRATSGWPPKESWSTVPKASRSTSIEMHDVASGLHLRRRRLQDAVYHRARRRLPRASGHPVTRATTAAIPKRPIVGVGALIFDRGRILMAQRGKEPLKGWWSLPGGALEVGESLDAPSAARFAKRPASKSSRSASSRSSSASCATSRSARVSLRADRLCLPCHRRHALRRRRRLPRRMGEARRR